MDLAQEVWEAIAASHPGLEVLVLIGSRARGEAHPGSDGDLGSLADSSLDRLVLHADLTQLLGTDAVDLAAAPVAHERLAAAR